MCEMLIRSVRVDDFGLVEEIENAADALFVDAFGVVDWPMATSAEARVQEPGFMLVACDGADRPVGFVHVIEVDGSAHLEQVSVLPSRGGQGVGRALVEAAKQEASRRGSTVMTLRTYADIPWNAPFYATCGFVETEPSTDFHRRLVTVERDLGLDRYGRRVQMSADLAGAEGGT